MFEYHLHNKYTSQHSVFAKSCYAENEYIISILYQTQG